MLRFRVDGLGLIRGERLRLSLRITFGLGGLFRGQAKVFLAELICCMLTQAHPVGTLVARLSGKHEP